MNENNMRTTPSYKLEIYEGPLDLLLGLIEKNKIDIFNIPISLILEQYINYINEMKSADIYVASEFIDMISRLIYIKCKMLLPKNKDEEDPRQQLVTEIMEYSQIKNISVYLEERYEYFGDRYCKEESVFEFPSDESETDNLIPKETLAKMLLKAIESHKERGKTYDFSSKILSSKKKISISEKFISILRKMYRGKTVSFIDLLNSTEKEKLTADDIVTTFSTLLRLIMNNTVIADNENILMCSFKLNESKKRIR